MTLEMETAALQGSPLSLATSQQLPEGKVKKKKRGYLFVWFRVLNSFCLCRGS